MNSTNIIIDLDGTVYRGDRLVDHAKAFFAMLKEKNVSYKVFTNCSMRTPEELTLVLKGMGLEVAENNIVTSGCIVRKYLQNIEKHLHIYAVGSASFKEHLHVGGIKFVTGTQSVADYVVVGFCTDFTFEDLKYALWHIQKGAKFITTNTDDTIPFGDDIVPHTGAICAFLEYASKQKPINLGKPSKYAGIYFREIFDSDDVIVIGDRVDTDMLFARNNGFTGCLVLTGIAEQRDTDATREQSFNIFKDLKEFCEFLDLKVEGRR